MPYPPHTTPAPGFVRTLAILHARGHLVADDPGFVCLRLAAHHPKTQRVLDSLHTRSKRTQPRLRLQTFGNGQYATLRLLAHERTATTQPGLVGRINPTTNQVVLSTQILGLDKQRLHPTDLHDASHQAGPLRPCWTYPSTAPTPPELAALDHLLPMLAAGFVLAHGLSPQWHLFARPTRWHAGVPVWRDQAFALVHRYTGKPAPNGRIFTDGAMALVRNAGGCPEHFAVLPGTEWAPVYHNHLVHTTTLCAHVRLQALGLWATYRP